MDETAFHNRADATLAAMLDALEPLDDAGTIELEYSAGMLNLNLPDGKQYILNKHAPSRQLWLSSPLSGGLHFSWEEAPPAWRLPDGRTLTSVLADELRALAGLEVQF